MLIEVGDSYNDKENIENDLKDILTAIVKIFQLYFSVEKVILPENLATELQKHAPFNNIEDITDKLSSALNMYISENENKLTIIVNPLIYNYDKLNRFYIFTKELLKVNYETKFKVSGKNAKENSVLENLTYLFSSYYSRREAVEIIDLIGNKAGKTFNTERFKTISNWYLENTLTVNQYKTIRDNIITCTYKPDNNTELLHTTKLMITQTIDYFVELFSYIDANIIDINEVTNSPLYNENINKFIAFLRKNFEAKEIHLKDGIALLENCYADLGLYLYEENGQSISTLGFIHISRKKYTQYLEKSSSKENSITIYLDHQIYGDILNNRKPQAISVFYSRLLELIKDNKATVYFSTFNILETSKRAVKENIYEELILIQRLSKCNFIDGFFNKIKFDPFDLYFNSIERIENNMKPGLEFTESILKLFTPEGLSYNMSDYGFDSRKFNNESPGQIKGKLKEVAENEASIFNSKEFQDSYKKALRKQYDENWAIISHDLREKLKKCILVSMGGVKLEDIPDFFTRKNIEIQIKTAQDDMLSQFESKIVEVTDENYNFQENWFELMFSKEWQRASSIPDKNFHGVIPALNIGLVESFQYHYDKKSNKKKNLIEQQYDALHFACGSKCDYFITEDKKLLKKAKFAIIEGDLSVKAVDIEEFMASIT